MHRWLLVLPRAGHVADHTATLGLERAQDAEIFVWCRNSDAVLLTGDKKLTKYLAEERATTPSVVIFRGYALDFAQLEADLLDNLEGIEQVVALRGHAVFSVSPNHPIRAQLLPLVTEVGSSSSRPWT
jgi:predicted nuclease of predicted toxin-antitoxin system